MDDTALYGNRRWLRKSGVRPAIAAGLWLVTSLAAAQVPFSRFEAFDRYDPTQLSYAVQGVEGESIDPRTLGLSWEIQDFLVPGHGGLDIVISRSFGRLSHTPSDMGHWYFGVPRIQIPTSPWRGPYDPGRADTPTFLAAWNNLYARLSYGSASICTRAGALVDEYVTGSQSGQLRGGIFFAAPIVLHIPGEGSKVLLEKLSSATQYPADVRYVTTDNWVARCLAPTPQNFWGGFEVVSPAGTRYVFDFIQYLVPGEYATLSSGGWIEMGLSRVEDVHGNWLNYVYDLAPGGTDLLHRIEASDGRLVTIEYHPGSVLGVDVKGSPLALISRINVVADGRNVSISYDYCDFAHFYIMQIGCPDIVLGPDNDLPVLHQVTYPDGTRTHYRYNANMYTTNVLIPWGGFEFLLERVTLPTGGVIRYDYHSGYSTFMHLTDSPSPRLSRRRTSGRDITPGTWNYSYLLQNHIERVTITGPARRDVYEFYEGTGTYEFMIARYPGQHQWPGSEPTDYDEVMGRMKQHSVWSRDGSRLLQTTRYEYALPEHIGKQWYGSNWLGWPTLVLAQTRRVPVSKTTVEDHASGAATLSYVTATPVEQFDPYGLPLVLLESGQNGAVDNNWLFRRTDLTWVHDTAAWIVGLPDTQRIGNSLVDYNYHPGTGTLSRSNEYGRISEFDWYADGNLAAVRWMRSGQLHQTTYSNYHRGIARQEQHPVNPVAGDYLTRQREVDDLGRVIWEEDFAGQRTTLEYNDMGRLRALSAPLQAPLEVSYDLSSTGQLQAVTQLRGGHRRAIDLDGFGRATQLRDFGDTRPGEAPLTRRWSYDAAGRQVYISDAFELDGEMPEYGVNYSYDEFDRPLQYQHTADGSTRSYCYVSSCNLGAYGMYFDATIENGYVVTDEEGHQTGIEFASFGGPAQLWITRIVQQVAESDFVVTRIARDAWGKITSVSQGSPTEDMASRDFIYDERQLLITEDHPESGRMTYTYDERGNRLNAVANGSEVLRWNYDGMDRQTHINYPDTASDIELRYDNNGRLADVRNPDTRWQYIYDAAGRIVQEHLLAAGRLLEFSFDYDLQGSLAAITYPSGNRVVLDPDDLGRPRQMGDAVLSADWWPDGQLRSMVYGNGTHTRVDQNQRGLPARRQVTASGGQSLLLHEYSYDRVGNMTALTDNVLPVRSIAMNYDPLGRLLQAEGFWGSLQFSFDHLGNIRRQLNGNFVMHYDYDEARNRLQAMRLDPWPATPVNHDARGNVIANGHYDFIYNAAAQLAGIRQFPDLAWHYDAKGHRTIVEQDGARDVHVYGSDGRLLHMDRCESRNLASDFLYLGPELVARFDEPCNAGCHP